MIITQINLESFGKFQDKKITLKDGINIIYGKNGQGKSTIKNFIELVVLGFSEENMFQNHGKYLEKYMPREMDTSFKGSISFKDEDQFIIEKNFRTPTDNKVLFIGGNNGVHSEKIEQLNAIGLLGVSGLKEDNERKLLAKVIRNIMDVKKSNLKGVSFNHVISEIGIDSDKIQNNDEYRESLEQLVKLKAQLETVSIDVERIKEQMSKLKQKNNASAELYLKISDLERKRDKIDQEEKTLNINILEGITKQISKCQEEFETVKDTHNYNGADMRNFIGLKKEYDEKEEEISKLNRELEALAGTLMEGQLNLDGNFIERLKDETVKERIITYINAYKSAKKDIEGIEEQITDYKNMVISEDAEVNSEKIKEMTDGELEELEKDYQRAETNLKLVKKVEPVHDSLEEQKHINRRIQNKENALEKTIPMAILSVILSVFSIIFLFVFGFRFYIVPMFFVSAILMSYFLYKRMNLIQRIAALENELLLNDDKVDKSQQIKGKYEKQLEYIVEKYGFDTYEEFDMFHKQMSSVRDYKNSRIGKRISKLENEITKLAMRRDNIISSISKSLTVDIGEDFDSRIDEISGYIKFAEKNATDKYEHVDKIKEELNECNIELKMIAFKMSQNPLSNSETDAMVTIKEFENKKDKRIELQNRLKRLEIEKKETLEQLENYRHTKDEIVVEINVLKSELLTYKQSSIAIKNSIAKLAGEQCNYKKISRQYNYYERKVRAYEKEIQCLNNVKRNLENASMKVGEDYSLNIIQRMNKILFNITQKYSEMKIDDEMKVYFKEDETSEWMSVNHLSTGTIDQVYFALRIGFADSVSSNMNLPIIFDNSFLQYDEKRLERLMEYIAGMNRQVVILTCHLREKKVLDHFKQAYNFIELT